MMKYRRIAAVALVLSLGPSIHHAAARPAPAASTESLSGAEVLEWNTTAADAALASGITPLFDPLHESRLYAMVHIAIHDALNAIDQRFETYALHDVVAPDASPAAAVATAARGVLVPVLSSLPELFPPGTAIELVEARYAEAMAGIPAGPAKAAGIELGQDAADAILAQRADDGSDTVFLDFDYEEGTEAGEFRFVEGAPFAVAPLWADVDPFVLRDGSQFRPPPPHALTSKQYAADFNELKSLGADDSTTRTTEQTDMAFTWFEASPLRWNRIARTVVEGAGLDAWEQARLFGLLNMALADGYIGNWDAKHHYDRWRPETAVRLAGEDGNPDTEPDADWTPLWGSSGATPEYDSGHTIEGAAAAAVLKALLGRDDVTFSVCSTTTQANTCDDPVPTLETYTSFSQAALENGLSRIYIGWHFRDSVERGLVHGRKIATQALAHEMRPVH